MARYTGPKVKISRRLNINVFENPKGDRAVERRPYPPGEHGRARRRAFIGTHEQARRVGDLRQPAVEDFIRPSGRLSGLRQLLSGVDAALSDCIQHEVLPDLAVMYAGGAAPNAQELLAGDECKNIIDTCLRDFDLTIIDTPPANGSADVRRISTLAGYSLIVARRNISFVSDVSVLAAQLTEDRAHVVGTVMNEA